MRLSYSALSTFKQCPLKYKWQYIDRIKVPPTQDLFFGILIHELLEIALKNDPIVLPKEKLIELYKNKWNPNVFKGEISEKEFYTDGLSIIDNFYSSHTPGLSTILSTEKFFEIYFEDNKIVGKIDRIDKLPTGELEIIDYKTNKKLPAESDFNFDLQLPLYEWAAKTIWNDLDNVKLTLYFLRHGKKITPPNIKSLIELQDFIRFSVDAIRKSDFLPSTSPLCGWCEYIHMCPEGQKYVNNYNTKKQTQIDKVITKSQLSQGSLF
jgi:RecB family exonuclease